MSTLAILFLALFAVFGLPLLQALVTDEARAWLPHLTRVLARAAARRLPSAHRERYEEEWLAELAAYSDRPLTAVFRSCGLRLGARALKTALSEEAPQGRVPIGDRLLAGVLLLFFAPLLMLISIAIRLDSAGPVFTRAMSVGPDGRPFVRMRFRTGRARHEHLVPVRLRDAWVAPGRLRLIVPVNRSDEPDRPDIVWQFDEGMSQEIVQHRVVQVQAKLWRHCDQTFVGRSLTRWGLQDLPALWNVLRGEMSMPYPWRNEA